MSGPEPKYGTVVERTFADVAAETELIEVTQADRDMAADYWMPPPNSSIDHLPWVRRANAAREGRSDDDALVQAFARHRISARPAPPLPDIEGLVERAKYAMERTAAQEYGPSDLIRELLDAIESLASLNEARRVALEYIEKLAMEMAGKYHDDLRCLAIATCAADARKAYLGEEGK